MLSVSFAEGKANERKRLGAAEHTGRPNTGTSTLGAQRATTPQAIPASGGLAAVFMNRARYALAVKHRSDIVGQS